MLNKYRVEYLKNGLLKFLEVFLSLIIVRLLTKTYSQNNLANYFLFLSLIDLCRLLFIGQESSIRNTGITKVSATVILITGIAWTILIFLIDFTFDIAPFAPLIVFLFPLIVALVILIESFFYIGLKSYGISIIMIVQKTVFLVLILINHNEIIELLTISFISIPLLFVRKLPLNKFGQIRLQGIRDQIYKSFPFFLLSGSVFILKGTDIWIINILLLDKDVNMYSYMVRYFGVFLMFNAIISAPLWNRLKNNQSNRKDLYREFNLLSALLLLILIIQFAIAENIIALIFGATLSLPSVHMFVWVFFVLISNRTAWTNQNLNSLNMAVFQSKVNLIMIVCNIPLSVLLVKYMGYIGVVVSTNVLMLLTWIIKKRKLNEILLLED